MPSAPTVDEGADDEPSVPAIDPNPTPGTPTEPPMSEKVPALLDFHTKRRMAPGTTSRGVSISSQRRWLGYWGRLLEGRDPRPKELGEGKMRKVKLDFVRIWGKGPSGVARKLGGDRIAVQVFRYKDSIATSLRERELALAAGGKDEFDDNDWDDKTDDMVVRVGGFTESDQRGDRSPSPTSSGYTTDDGASPASPSSPIVPSSPIDAVHASDSPRTLIPHTAYLPPSFSNPMPRSKEAAKEVATAEGGILIDADREVQLKLLLGKSGRKHGALPAMASEVSVESERDFR